MKSVALALLVLLPLCLASCGPASHGPAKMPPAFLHSPSPAWTQWLDSETHYGSFTRFAVRDILRDLAGPADLKMEPSPALDQKVPHIDLKTLTVRQALWKVSSEYGVTVALAITYEPRTFLGILETESKRDGPGGVTTMTEVMQGDPREYQKLKAEKRIYREEVQGDTLYYAVQKDRDLRFPNGSSAMIIEVQRYKIPALDRPPTPAAPPRAAATVAAPPLVASEAFELEKTRKFLAGGGAANSAPPDETSKATRLHQAATYGWFRVAELLLDHGADINALDKDRRTPLATAVDHRHAALAQLLIERGADIHLADVHGNTPLHYAVREDMVGIAEMLLVRGADANGRPQGGLGRPIDVAAWAGNPAVIDLLVAHGARVNYENETYCYALHDALRFGRLEAANALVRHGAPLDEFSAAGLGDTAYLRTCLERDKEWVRTMANNKARVSLRSYWTPLDFAAVNNQVQAAEMLLDAGADPNGATMWEPPVLYVAAEKDYLDLATLLIARGAKIEAPYEMQGSATALHAAASANHPEMIDLLIRHGAKVDSRDSNAMTPLLRAAAHGWVPAVKALLDRGADLHARSAQGDTALHIVEHESWRREQDGYDTARFLLEKGAEVNALNAEGRTPLDDVNSDRIKDLLRQHGARSGKDLSAAAEGPQAREQGGKE